MLPNSGSTNRPVGRSICLRRDTSLARNLTWRRPTRYTKRTSFFCHMISRLAAAKFTNMRWLLSISPAVTKKQSHLPRRTLKRLRKRSSQFTNAALWLGLRCCRLTLDASLWAGLRKKWKNTKLTFVAAALKFTEIRLLSSVSIVRLLSVCLAINTPWRCLWKKASGQLSGWKDCPMLSALWTTRWQVSLVKSPLLLSKKNRSPCCRQNITDLLVLPKRNFHLSSMWDICIRLANLRAEPKEQLTRSGLWKSTRSLKIKLNLIHRLSIICLTGRSAALFAKSCWLCRLIHSCPQPEMPVCQGLYAVICYPPLCIKWR